MYIQRCRFDNPLCSVYVPVTDPNTEYSHHTGTIPLFSIPTRLLHLHQLIRRGFAMAVERCAK